MASNPYVNKVVFGNQTVMDISDTDAEEADVVEGKTFYKKSGARATGTASYYSPNDTASTDIDDDDLVPFYDDSASAKKNSLWSNIKSVLKTYFDNYYHPKTTVDNVPTASSDNLVKSGGVYSKMAHEIIRTGVTASAGGTVRIPAGSDTDSRITTSSVVIPICDDNSGVPVKYKSCTASTGYASIVVAEAITNKSIGVIVINQ